MRKKAEQEIRRAAESLGGGPRFRIDRVRERTSLIRKVFDKTLIHMAQVGTITFYKEDTAGMSDEEIRGLLWQGEIRQVSFAFIDGTWFVEPETSAPAPARPVNQRVTVTLKGVRRDHWDRFRHFCQEREGKGPEEKLLEMILRYNQQAEPYRRMGGSF